MSDLISRSSLINKIRGIVPGSQDVDFIVGLIENQPTAFDTEKVIKQLLDMRLIRVEQCCEDYEIEVMTESNFDDAIDIVKKGGVE